MASLIQPVILSGGAGTRLWPVSREQRPKQFLTLMSDKSILQETALNDPPPNVVQALLRISMPLFITPPGAKANVIWSAERADDRWWLVMENTGNAHAQITEARLESGPKVKATGYLLPGEKRRVAVDAPPASIVVKLYDQQEQTVQVRGTP